MLKNKNKKWMNTTLGNILTFQRGHDLPIDEREGGLFPVVASTGVVGYHTDYKADGPGVVIGRSGSIGGGQFIKTKFWPLNTTLYVKDFKNNDIRFCYYLIKNIDFSGFNVGSGVPTLNRNHIHPMSVSLPPLPEQRAIAEILSSIDDKIELNNQMNRTLEATAQAIFKQWFVNYEFPTSINEGLEPFASSGGKMIDSELGPIPEGWRVEKLDNLIETVSVTHKFNKDKLIFLNTSDILDGQVLHENYSDVHIMPGQAKKSIKKDDILYSEIRPKNKRYTYVDFDADDYVVSTKLMVLRVKVNIDPIVIYYHLKSDVVVGELQIAAESRSGTFPQITFEQVRNLKMIIPDESILKVYTEWLKSIYSKINQNNKESKTLSSLRDSLLPKLMSGELRVPEEIVKSYGDAGSDA